MSKIISSLRIFLIYVTALGLAFSGLFVSISQVNADEIKPAEFAACVDRTNNGSVLILMDESNSIYESDPDGNRIIGAQVLIDEILEMANIRGAEISVRLAGFGADYVARSGSATDWDKLSKPTAANAERLKKTASDVWGGANPVSNANRSETDVWSAADGALRDLASQNSECKLLVFFKDGADWQFFNEGFEQTATLPSEIQSLLDQGTTESRNAASKLAEDDICRPTGLADAYRSTGIFVLGVAVPTQGESGNFDKFEGFVEGAQNCGTLPARGQVIQAGNVDELPWKFSEALDPNAPSQLFEGEFAFQMSDALVGVNILASGSDSYQLVPPATCSIKSVDLNSASGSIGGSVQWSRKDYSANQKAQAFKLNLKYNPAGTPECWKGEWKVVTEPNTKSQIDLDADLEAVAVFSTKEPLIYPGGEPQKYTIKVQRISTGEEVSQSDLHPDLRLTLDGQLYDPQGKRLEDLFLGDGGSLDQSNIFSTAKQLNFPDNAPLGNYSLILTLGASVNGLPGISLNPQSTETKVIVGAAPTLPKAIFKGAINFGTITGFEAATQTIEFEGGTEDACVDLDSTKVSLAAAPKDSNYFVNGDCVSVPAGEKVAIEVQLVPSSDNPVSANGPISGTLLFASVLERASDQAPIEIAAVDFVGYQEAQPNQLVQLIASILFLVLGILISFLFLILISKLVARFPSQKEVNEMQLASAKIPIRVTKSMGQVSVQAADGNSLSSAVANSNDWEFVMITNQRRTAMLDGETVRAKSGGLNFTSPGYAEPSGGFAGVGGPVVGLSRNDNGKPRIPLALQKSWLALFTPTELANFQQSQDSTLYGDLIAIASYDAGFEGRSALAEEAAIGIATNIEKRTYRTSKPAASKNKQSEAEIIQPQDPPGDVFRF